VKGPPVWLDLDQVELMQGRAPMSGMYDMAPVRLCSRRACLAFTDGLEAAMSLQRHLDRIAAPVLVSHGTLESPEFHRQAKDFAAALEAAGKAVEFVVGQNYHDQDMWETLGNPYGPNGRAALALMGI
jgi:arylformamidase